MLRLPLVLSCAAILLPSLSLIYALGRVLYNIFFHPLRSYPGPLLCRATLLTHQREQLRGRFHVWLHELHTKYGPVVRFAPNELSFIDPSVWKDVYGHRAGFEMPKEFYGDDSFGNPPGLIRADHANHARQRKLVAHAFSDKALREQETLVKGYAELLINRLKNTMKHSWEGRVDLTAWYNFTTFDVMADLTFGEPLNLLQGSAYSEWVRAMFDNIKLALFHKCIRRWPALDMLLKAMVPAHVKEKRRVHITNSVQRVEKRLARKTDRPDIWTYVLRHSEDEENRGKGLAPTEMRSNASLFMTAGTETTATELSGVTYFLLKNPQVFERLKKEIRDAFPTYDDMHMNELSQLKYLNACIEEGLRLYPPVALGLPRTSPRGGATVAGRWVPEGVMVQLPHYAAYHSATNFKFPDDYIPERWLPEGKDAFASDNKEVLNPFLYGPRNCLGKNLAYHEMRVVLASMIWNFDMELCNASDRWIDQNVYLVWKKDPLMVKLKSIRD